ncbi:MAG: hypothetical protein ABEL04_00895 [Salinibacter sp.]|uniref:hypothetical protein n=1 Tax=Salinibacter sp. TaxID=2065818 RepID=UPI0035D41578
MDRLFTDTARTFTVAVLLSLALVIGGCDSGGSSPNRNVTKTFTVTVQSITSNYPYADQNNIGVAYAIDGEVGKVITLQRGETYEFVLDYSSNHPFYVGTNAEGKGTGRYTDGVEMPDGNNTQGISVFFTVPSSAPDSLFYQCGIHQYMGGKMNIAN